jgi:hypothetical protein
MGVNTQPAGRDLFDLPIQKPSTFELAARTAKTLGLKIPLSLLARADQVIE